ncbi:MAG: NAD(P)/FAD-dependent oxidoreductase [Candidatus Woesearchaeota archaeon]
MNQLNNLFLILMEYDVIIIGGGPAGLFAAYELCVNSPNLKVALIEKGSSIKERKRSDVMCGIGGAGTFSDGKLHFTPVLSHEKMLDLYTEDEYQKFLDYVDQLLTDFGVNTDYYPKNIEQVKELVDDAKKNSIKLYIRKARHVGSDVLPEIILNIEEFLRKKDVEIIDNTDVSDLLIKDGKLSGIITKEKKEYHSRSVIVAPGRYNARWMQEIADKYDLGYKYEKVEVGVRVEFPEAVMKKHADLMYETIFLMHTPTFDDAVRTFCPCPNGLVAKEKYDGFVCVNGHSNSDHLSENSNFAFVSEISLTEPVENTIAYAKSIAQLATTIGGGKPILQRLSDLRMGRRSTWSRINKSFVTPSLKDVTPGDIAMALPFRTVKNLLEGFEMLDSVLPGINSGSTLLYAPEIKLRSSKMKTDKNLETHIKGLYVAGDGAGVSGNIVGAAATGIIAAQGIISKNKNR